MSEEERRKVEDELAREILGQSLSDDERRRAEENLREMFERWRAGADG